MADRPKVPAADSTLRVLSLLATARGPLQASTIAARLELPRSTVYYLLGVLIEHGFVMRLDEEHRYGLGVAAVELSTAYQRQAPLARIGRLAVRALVERVGVSGHLAVLSGRDVLYVVEERAPRAPYLVTDVDVRLPAQNTASGRAILAALPPAQLRALYPNDSAFDRPSGDAPAIAKFSQLRALLRETSARGYAVEEGDVTPGFASVAVPVLDHRSWPMAGVALTFPAPDFDDDARTALAEAARTAAADISRRIHGRGGA